MKTRLINGVDIVDIARIDSIIDERKDSLIRKLFTKNEKEYLEARGYKAETISGLFAGKEAVSKAIGTGIGKVGFKDIEIYHDELGKPNIRLAEWIKKEYNISYMEI